jgi:hypothetical protein
MFSNGDMGVKEIEAISAGRNSWRIIRWGADDRQEGG